MSSDGLSGSICDCDRLDEKAHQGSNVENVRKRYANRLIMVSISKKYTNGLHHVGGVQKGGNISSFHVSPRVGSGGRDY
jgi:hypothetical protein